MRTEILRRSFLIASARVGVAAWVLSQLGVKLEAADAKPNLVVMVADDMGWGDVGYHGSEIQTPNIDRLVAEGVVMDRFYAFPICSPTRVALMTGRSPNRMGIGSPIGSAQVPEPPLDEHFLPQSFKTEGYQTWMCGKWHIGDDTEGHLPNGRGFDYFYGHHGAAVDYYAHTDWRRNTADWYRNTELITEDGYATDLIADEGIKKLKTRDRARPFLLYLPFGAGHTPLQAPAALIEKYSHIANANRRTYAAMIDAMDQAIGRVLATLDDEGLRENTLVVFFSDNGGNSRIGGANNGAFRGAKGSVFEGGTRVPAVMRWPGVLPAGHKSEQAFWAVDWFPTLATALGVKPKNKKPFDGRNLWPALQSNTEIVSPEGMVIARSKTEGAVWDGQWKLVRQPRETLLFDIKEDPNEKNDLSGDYPEVVNRLSARLDDMCKTLPERTIRGRNRRGSNN